MSVSQEQSTDDEGYTDTDTGDFSSVENILMKVDRLTTKDSLDGSVGLGDTLSLGGTSGERDDSGVWTGVNLRSEGSVGESGVKLNWHPLVPDGSGDNVSESTSQVV